MHVRHLCRQIQLISDLANPVQDSEWTHVLGEEYARSRIRDPEGTKRYASQRDRDQHRTSDVAERRGIERPQGVRPSAQQSSQHSVPRCEYCRAA